MDASHTTDSVSPKVVDQVIYPALGLAEDNDSSPRAPLAEDRKQLVVLVVLLAKLEVLLDARIGLQVRVTDLDVDWEHVAERVCEVLHLSGPGGAPHESLSVRSHLVKDLPDVLFEAHVLY